MPAVSKAQHGAAGAAYAAKRGKKSVASLGGASRRMYEHMTAEQLKHMIQTKTKGLPRHKA